MSNKSLMCFRRFVLLLVCCLFAVELSGQNRQIDIPFEGPMDCRFGYEDLKFGMSYKEISEMKKYPVLKRKYDNQIHYYLGYESTSGSNKTYSHYAHGKVNMTNLFFCDDKLYRVEDVLSVRNPSLEYLHERYGEFSDENVISSFTDTKGLSAIYTNKDYFNAQGKYSLQIQITKKGLTTVFILDPFVNSSLSSKNVQAFMKDRKSLPANIWHMFASVDGKNESYNYTFINQADDGNKILVQYVKNPDNEVRSYVKAGFNYGTNTSGEYEIKTKDEIITKKYSIKSVQINPYDWHSYNYSCNDSESARWMLNLILSNDSIQVRKKDKITNFSLSGLSSLLALNGITPEELDYAITNEEF